MASREAACIRVRAFVLRSAFLVACGGSTPPSVVAPEPVVEQTPEERPPSHRFTHLTIGADNGCVLDRSSPICWGSFFGPNHAPRVLTELQGARRVEIRTGMTGCGLLEDGALDCFGAYGEEMRYAAIDQRTAELQQELDDPDLTEEREAEIDAQIAALEDAMMPIRVASNVRDFTVFESGGCYIDDEALRCWDETQNQEGGVPTVRTISGVEDVVQLDSSVAHQCALQSDGRVRCWGFGMGLGWSPEDEDEPTWEPGLTPARDAVEIALGEDFTCFRRGNGTVACWGYITELMVDEDDIPAEHELLEIPDIEDARMIAAGAAHACAIVGGGRVRCWGENRFGELGTGDARTVRGSIEVAMLSPARELALGDHATCALVGEEIRCVGSNRYDAFGPEPESADVVIFPLRGSRVLTPGHRTCVEGADGLACTSWTLHRDITESIRVAPIPSGDTIDQLEGASTYECIRRGGELACKLSDADHVTLSNVAQVSVGSAAACARMQNRKVQCWQFSRFSREASMIAPTETPTEIAGLTRVESVDVGARHACAVHTNGRVTCWGDNSGGLIRQPASSVTAPLEVEGLTNIVQVSVDRMSTCVRKRDQTVTCRTTRDWSVLPITGVVDMADSFGRFLLGADHRVHLERFGRLTPVELPDEVVEIAAGTSHMCARARDGRVWCWGDGDHGELGVLPTWVHFAPVTVSATP